MKLNSCIHPVNGIIVVQLRKVYVNFKVQSSDCRGHASFNQNDKNFENFKNKELHHA